MKYFGEKWDAPAFERALEVPVPTGETCRLCTEKVADDDSGILTPYMDSRGRLSDSPIHIECHLRSILGSVGHLEGRCSCVTGRLADDQTSASYREQARAVIDWLREHDAYA